MARYRSESEEEHAARKARVRATAKRERKKEGSALRWRTAKDVGRELPGAAFDMALLTTGAGPAAAGLSWAAKKWMTMQGPKAMVRLLGGLRGKAAVAKIEAAAERAGAATKMVKKIKRPSTSTPIFKGGPKSATQAAQRGRVMTTRKAQAIVEGRKLTTKGSGEYAKAVKFLRDQEARKVTAKAAKIRPKAKKRAKGY